MKKLATHVHVADERGDIHVFGPDSKLPGWAAEAITNPAAWSEVDEPEPADTGEDPDPSTAAEQQLKPPPKSGPGSGVEHWTAYAKDQGVAIDGDPKRDELIAALEAEGIATE